MKSKSYLIGFGLSLGLTLLAYVAVTNDWFARRGLLAFISCLALAQFFVQMVFFLHLGKESRPRWKLAVFGFMTLIVMIVVVGSLWIMANLDYHRADSHENSDEFIIRDEGYKQ